MVSARPRPGDSKIYYFPTDIQLADVLTKPILPERYTALTNPISQSA